MIEQKLLNINDLIPFGPVITLSERAEALVQQQKATWSLANQNYKGLNNIQLKEFLFDGFRITVQFNAERIRSSAAKTDVKTISERPCFLCLTNLPDEQKGLLLFEKYLILANPFPIFPVHLTISEINHTPQLIDGRINDLLEISKTLPEFTVFYNGPNCGASAPDHFHFQAAIKGHLPIEKEISELTLEIVSISENIKVYNSKNYLRSYILIESDDKNLINTKFIKVYKTLQKNNGPLEPMVNILCSFSNGKWQLVIFPRDKQRPSHFFEEGNKQIIVGPAAVELGGLMILPRKEDFEKITRKNIIDIYNEVTINAEDFKNLVTALK